MTEFLSVENYQSYSPVAYEVVLSVLALGFAVMGAAFVYFIASSSNIAPRWRITSTISAVVMVSAFLELFLLWFDWQSVFALSGGTWERDPDAGVFSNGYRYMNWAIDVPMLMLQLLIVLGFVGKGLLSTWGKIAAAGLLMIFTGYVGQFYEVASLPAFLIWGAVSTVFYVYFLYAVLKAVSVSLPNLPAKAAAFGRLIRWWVPVTWTLYPIAYAIPAFWVDQWAVVTKQLTFTTADIATKVIFGIFVGQMALSRSRAEDNFGLAEDTQQEPEEHWATDGQRGSRRRAPRAGKDDESARR